MRIDAPRQECIAAVQISELTSGKTRLISKGFTLGRNERLKSRKIIESLFKDGRSVTAFPIRITWRLLDEVSGSEGAEAPVSQAAPSLQAGFSASSRNFKKAVDRNRVKRLLRESYRKRKGLLAVQLAATGKRIAIFIIYTGKELPGYEIVEEKMEAVLKKLADQLKAD